MEPPLLIRGGCQLAWFERVSRVKMEERILEPAAGLHLYVDYLRMFRLLTPIVHSTELLCTFCTFLTQNGRENLGNDQILRSSQTMFSTYSLAWSCLGLVTHCPLASSCVLLSKCLHRVVLGIVQNWFSLLNYNFQNAGPVSLLP